MTYYVYQNWTAEDKAKIHHGSCRHCNFGKGKHPDASNRNGQWDGPFGSYEQAKSFAISTKRPVSDCFFCRSKQAK